MDHRKGNKSVSRQFFVSRMHLRSAVARQFSRYLSACPLANAFPEQPRSLFNFVNSTSLNVKFTSDEICKYVRDVHRRQLDYIIVFFNRNLKPRKERRENFDDRQFVTIFYGRKLSESGAETFVLSMWNKLLLQGQIRNCKSFSVQIYYSARYFLYS